MLRRIGVRSAVLWLTRATLSNPKAELKKLENEALAEMKALKAEAAAAEAAAKKAAELSSVDLRSWCEQRAESLIRGRVSRSCCCAGVRENPFGCDRVRKSCS